MEAVLNQVFELLTNPPGNLAYYVILAFTVVGALQSSLNHYRKSGFPQGNRMVFGLSLLLVFQLVQFLIAGLAWQGLLDPQVWLPPLDRLVIHASLILIVWLWLVPEQARLLDTIFSAFFILALVFFSYSLDVWRTQPVGTAYNALWLDWGASLSGMIFLGLGALGLWIRRPNSWGIGSAMFVLLFGGLLYQYIFPRLDADYAAPIRLAQLMAYPWLLALPQRFPIPFLETVTAPPATVAERRRYNTDIIAVQEFIDMLVNPPSEQGCARIARALSQLMLADYCLLVSPAGEDDSLTVACGYNLIGEKEVEGFSLEARSAPMIASALKRGKSLRLPASSTSSDLDALANRLHLPRVGHLLAMPVRLPHQPSTMGVILLSPFSNRGWSRDDQTVLDKFTTYLTQGSIQTGSTETNDKDIQDLRQVISTLEDSNREILSELEKTRQTLVEEQSRAASLAEMVSAQQGIPASPDQVSPEAGEAEPGSEAALERETQAETLQDQVSRQAFEEVQANLRLALEQVAELRAELSRVDRAPLEQTQVERDPLERAQVDLAPLELDPFENPDLTPNQTPEGEPILSFEEALVDLPELLDVQQLIHVSDPFRNEDEITTVIQELRQPMSSIMGYTDLLLGESVGILGALQRKFLERIRSSVERLGGLADDLMQLTEMETTSEKLHPAAVVLDQVVDTAVAEVKDQLSKKNILLELDIPQHLPDLRADQDALRQVLVGLLQNAANRTAEEGKIGVKASVETKEHEPGYVLIQVSDTGNGIAPQDLPRVFSRLFKSVESPEAPGEAGVDLALVKGLVEAHSGRIWVDSTPGTGSTFSMLLPLDSELESG